MTFFYWPLNENNKSVIEIHLRLLIHNMVTFIYYGLLLKLEITRNIYFLKSESINTGGFSLKCYHFVHSYFI